MRHFKQIFSEVMEFVLIDAPFKCQDEPMRETKKFLDTPSSHFKQWLIFHQQLSAEEKAYSAPDIVTGLEEATQYLVDVLKGPDGPFDGVLCFSQGGIIFRHFYRITQEIDPQVYQVSSDPKDGQIFQMPKFMISVACPVFEGMKFKYKDQYYEQRTTKQFSFPSIHLVGTKDKYYQNLKCFSLFTDESQPKQINFDEGHKFPRAISDDDYGVLKEFVFEQYTSKNGDAEGFDVDTERYNFEVRFDKGKQ